MQPNENHEKIIAVIEEKGPRLPMQIAGELKIDSLFISAFLSELANQKRVRMSHLKVGGSPLYFLVGQESQLENYQRYLNKKESEAFLLLKKSRILKDSEQEPSIRVALRSMRDFAFGFKRNEEIFWRYYLISEEETKEILEPKKIIKHEIEIDEEDDTFEIGENVKIKIKEKPPEEKFKKIFPETKTHKEAKTTEETQTTEEKPPTKIKKEINLKEKEDNQFKNPLIIQEKKKSKKEKPKSEFVQKTINFIQNKGLKITQQKDHKAKEYNCIININSDLGPINFLTQAKDKKTITEGDLKKLLSNAQSMPLPALMLYNGEISKKAKEFTEKYTDVLKINKIN
jgi:hypothetical protein